MLQKTELAITSGRYDPVHVGHVLNIKRIFNNGNPKFLRVFVLDYPDRRYPIDYCVKILKEALIEYSPSIQIVVNKTHFGKITKDELESLCFDKYYGGNLRVLRHIESLGFKAEYVERAYNYAASKYSDPE